MGIVNQHTLIFFWLLVEHEKSHMCTCHDVCSGVANLRSEQSWIKDAKTNISKNGSHLTVSIHGGSLPLSYEAFIIVDISCLVLSPLLSLGPKVGIWIWGTLAFTGGHGSGCVGAHGVQIVDPMMICTPAFVFSMILIPCWSQMIFLSDSSGFSQPVGHLYRRLGDQWWRASGSRWNITGSENGATKVGDD